MSKVENKMMRRRLRSAYMSSVLSISLVLLLVGSAALLLVNAHNVTDYFKENMKLSILMKPEVSDAGALEYQVELDAQPFVHSTEFISKAQGTREMEAMLGEGFLEVFETSPIPASIDIRLRADYVALDSIERVKSIILKSPVVDEVSYQQTLIEALNENIQKISFVLAIFIALLLRAHRQYREAQCLCPPVHYPYDAAGRCHTLLHQASFPASGRIPGYNFCFCSNTLPARYTVFRKEGVHPTLRSVPARQPACGARHSAPFRRSNLRGQHLLCSEPHSLVQPGRVVLLI